MADDQKSAKRTSYWAHVVTAIVLAMTGVAGAIWLSQRGDPGAGAGWGVALLALAVVMLQESRTVKEDLAGAISGLRAELESVHTELAALNATLLGGPVPDRDGDDQLAGHAQGEGDHPNRNV
jgi:hypothetical protein